MDQPEIRVRELVLLEGPRKMEPLSFDLTPGCLHLITGENGSGKSTLLDILALRRPALRPNSVIRHGHRYPREIAYLPQRINDASDIRIRSLLRLARRGGTGRGAVFPHGCGRFRESTSVGRLSGGQQQRLWFDLVSSQPQRIHMYDEPLQHLDGSARHGVVERIRGLVEQRLLVVVAEHEPELAGLVSMPCRTISLDEP